MRGSNRLVSMAAALGALAMSPLRRLFGGGPSFSVKELSSSLPSARPLTGGEHISKWRGTPTPGASGKGKHDNRSPAQLMGGSNVRRAVLRTNFWG